uniref:Uncharacterized protein n=1 Tax=Panagrolaimus sp. ES5 TaxID=591445 RepID=A0AC34FRC8_9BILA
MTTSIEMGELQSQFIPKNTEALIKKAENEITATPSNTPVNPSDLPSHVLPFENEITATPSNTPVNPSDLPSHVLPFNVSRPPTPDVPIDIPKLTCCSDCSCMNISGIITQLLFLGSFNVLCAFYGLASFNGFNVKMEVDEPTFYALMALTTFASAICGGSMTMVGIMYKFAYRKIEFSSKWRGVIISVIFISLGAFVAAASGEEVFGLWLVLYGKTVKKFEKSKWFIFTFSTLIGLGAGIISGLSHDKDITSKAILLVTLATAPITLFFLHLGFTVIHPTDALIIDGVSIIAFVAIFFMVYNKDSNKNGFQILVRKICPNYIAPDPLAVVSNNVENV